MSDTYITHGSFVLLHQAKDQDEAETHAKSFVERMDRAVSDGALLTGALFIPFTEKSNPEQLDLFEDK